MLTATESARDAARALAKVIEPIVGQVYFAPECHRRYAALGFSGSPGGSKDGVAFPDGPAYFTSRGLRSARPRASSWRLRSASSTRRSWCPRSATGGG